MLATSHPHLSPMQPVNPQPQPHVHSLPPAQVLAQMSNTEQIRLIMSHPFFTGRCPQCRRSIQMARATMNNCTCHHCGWSDHQTPEV